MGVLGKIFTWWDGATIGTDLALRSATRVGEDTLGNIYFEGKPLPDGRKRRHVVYKGANDASRVPPEWHGWLHHQVEGLPDQSLPPVRRWEKEAQANLTGTREAYRPAGALEAGGKRATATGDYEAWSPDGA
ncbi:MAG: NADH:ubiquinone oxidoreductase subunit NDUFA12 [Sphingomonadaceae bacterium]